MNSSKFCTLSILIALLSLNSIKVHADKRLDEFLNRGIPLPSYCKGRGSPSGTDERSAAEAYLGDSFIHAHHLCWSLAWLWEIEFGNRQLTGSHVKRIIKSLNYYYKRTSKDHPIMHDVHLAYARAYRHLGDEIKALEHKEEARKSQNRRAYPQKISPKATSQTGKTKPAKPTRFTAKASAYEEMSDKMVRLGLFDEAEELLELALQLEPDSRRIQTKLKTLRTKQKREGSNGSLE